MKKHLYIAYLAYKAIVLSMVCLLYACSGGSPDEPTSVVPGQPVGPTPPEQQEQPLTFVSQYSSRSRATEAPLEDTHELFKVWSYKERTATTSEMVMPGYQVKYLGNADRWQYDGDSYPWVEEFVNPVDGHDRQYLKYWDASSLAYGFYAYAPTDWPGITCDKDGLTIPNIAGHSSNDPGTQLVIARHRRQLSGSLRDADELDVDYSFPTISNFYDPVPLRFHHLFSRVTFKIYNSSSIPVRLLRGSVKLNNDQKFITNGDFVNDHWESDGTSDSSTGTLLAFEFQDPKVLKANATAEEAELLSFTYELSQTLTSSTKEAITINLTVNNTVVEDIFDLPSPRWEYGMGYVYYIKINIGEGSPIFIDLDLDKFTPDDNYEEVEDTQTNW